MSGASFQPEWIFGLLKLASILAEQSVIEIGKIFSRSHFSLHWYSVVAKCTLLLRPQYNTVHGSSYIFYNPWHWPWSSNNDGDSNNMA